MESRSKSILFIWAGLSVGLLLIFAAASFYHLKSMRTAMLQVSTVFNEKVNIINQMSNVVRERSLRMYAIYFNEDAWHRDEEFMRFNSLALRFIELRSELEGMDLSDVEREALAGALQMVSVTQPLQSEIVDRMLSGETEGVYVTIGQDDLPEENNLLQTFSEFFKIVRNESMRAGEDAEQQYIIAKRLLFLFMVVIVSVTLLGSNIITRRIIDTEKRLRDEKEMAEGTLNNIIDGVLTTDEHGKIIALNQPALTMLAVDEAQTVNSHIDSVYTLRDLKNEEIEFNSDIVRVISGAVARKSRYHVLQNKYRDKYFIEETISPLFDSSGNLQKVSYIFRDVTADLIKIEKVSWQANHDPLTKIKNRRAFENALKQLLQEVKAYNKSHILLCIDLDDFKSINDIYGHYAGDEYLINVSNAISSCIRKQDVCARMGGDEFSVVLLDCPLNVANKISEKILEKIRNMDMKYDGNVIASKGASIGLTALSSKHYDIKQVIEKADKACYLAKNQGKNRVCTLLTD